jgi:hypothetical protein
MFTSLFFAVLFGCHCAVFITYFTETLEEIAAKIAIKCKRTLRYTCLNKKIDGNISNFSHIPYGKILRSHYIILPYLSFETAEVRNVNTLKHSYFVVQFSVAFNEEDLKKTNSGSEEH